MKRKKFTAVVPVSSMADIAFLLLIFFMVTSVLKVDADIPLVLPDASGQELTDKELNVSISKENVFYFNNVPMDYKDLIGRVRGEVIEKPDTRVLINAHNEIDFERVHKLLDGFKKVGARNFALVTKQNERKN